MVPCCGGAMSPTGKLVLEHRVEEAGKVGVETLVAGDELVGEAQAGHQAPLLEPEDGAE